MVERHWVLVLLLGLAVLGTWRLSQRLPDPRWPAEDCEPWMADAFPGVGPKTRAEVTAHIRAWRLEELPAGLAAQVRDVFRPPER